MPKTRRELKKEMKIGFSIEDMKGERWQTDLEEFQQRAHELGGAVVTRSANGDDDLQFRQINELLKSGIDVLVFLPHDTSKDWRIVEAAHAKHVPVISYDRLASASVDLYVGFDLFSVGIEQAQVIELGNTRPPPVASVVLRLTNWAMVRRMERYRVEALPIFERSLDRLQSLG